MGFEPTTSALEVNFFFLSDYIFGGFDSLFKHITMTSSGVLKVVIVAYAYSLVMQY